MARIFVLEDDPERIASLAIAFDKGGHTVHWAHTIERADTFQPPYDLILLDHDLGGRALTQHEDNGLNFVRAIKDRINLDAVIIIHSWNIDAGKSMLKELANFPEAMCALYRSPEFNILIAPWTEF